MGQHHPDDAGAAGKVKTNLFITSRCQRKS
jgi:hypothetical protein